MSNSANTQVAGQASMSTAEQAAYHSAVFRSGLFSPGVSRAALSFPAPPGFLDPAGAGFTGGIGFAGNASFSPGAGLDERDPPYRQGSVRNGRRFPPQFHFSCRPGPRLLCRYLSDHHPGRFRRLPGPGPGLRSAGAGPPGQKEAGFLKQDASCRPFSW